MRQGAGWTREGDNVKRRLLTVAVFVLAGAVVNVAVAWGCALWIDIEGYSQFAAGRPLQQYEYAGWYVYIRQHHGAVRIERVPQGPGHPYDSTTSQESPHDLPMWSRAQDRSTWPPIGPLYGIEDARGWPLYSLHCRVDLATILLREPAAFNELLDQTEVSPEDLSSVLAPGDAVSGGLLLSYNENELRILPFRPLWPGFAINTILYAIALWVSIWGVIALRRFVRVKRGLCPACAYPRAQSNVCSECGEALPDRAKATT